MFGYAKGAISSLESGYLIVLASFVFLKKPVFSTLHCSNTHVKSNLPQI